MRNIRIKMVYLVWLFLRITTTCNLSIIGLVRKGFPESLAHAQTVDTRSLFPPPTWPGYEARLESTMAGESSLLEKGGSKRHANYTLE